MVYNMLPVGIIIGIGIGFLCWYVVEEAKRTLFNRIDFEKKLCSKCKEEYSEYRKKAF